MAAPSTWPPPPDTPNPLAAHDGFLTACVLNSSAKKPVSRLSLMRDLRKEQGVDARQSLAIVNNYCDRHRILTTLHGQDAKVNNLILIILSVIVIASATITIFLERNLRIATTVAEETALYVEIINTLHVMTSITVAFSFGLVIFAVWRNRSERRNAEDARKKLAA